MDSTDISSKRL